jgi:F-type H+-transporting ATPase subunit b
MKVNIWTLVFQVINFFVLVYILKRVLYIPIKEIMEKRRKAIAKSSSEAEEIKKEAAAALEQNRLELQNLKERRQELMDKMEKEAAAEREKILKNAEEEAQKLLEKRQAALAIEKKRNEAELTDKALDLVETFSAGLLKDIAGEDLHKAVFARLQADIPRIAGEIKDTVTQDKTLKAELISAYPLSDNETDDLRNKLAACVNKEVTLETSVDTELIAGAKLKYADRTYDFSLKGQINAFRDRLGRFS